MFAHPIQTGNVVLILVGLLLIASGPYIVYRTVQGIRLRHLEEPDAPKQWFSNALNFLIAFLFFSAGVLFVLNNLRGNPLANS